MTTKKNNKKKYRYVYLCFLSVTAEGLPGDSQKLIDVFSHKRDASICLSNRAEFVSDKESNKNVEWIENEDSHILVKIIHNIKCDNGYRFKRPFYYRFYYIKKKVKDSFYGW